MTYFTIIIFQVSVDDLEEYRRMKNDIYKKELDKQIEEKRKLEKERKAKAQEVDRKLEEKLRMDDERILKENQDKEEVSKSHQVLSIQHFLNVLNFVQPTYWHFFLCLDNTKK